MAMTESALRGLVDELANVAREEIERFTTEAKIELGLRGPTLGQIARTLRTKLGGTESYKYLEPDFVRRLDQIAETP